MNSLTPSPAFMADDEFAIFDESASRFFAEMLAPEQRERWIAQGAVDREAWLQAGQSGFLCPSMPLEYGGAGGDFRHDAIILRQLFLKGGDGWGVQLHNAIVAPYILHYGTEAQKLRWLPRLATGELIGAIAMTEPGTGSDLQAIKTRADKDGASYLLSGSKTFITNGQLANLIIVVAKTDPQAGGKGISLVVLETDGAEGFRRGRNLDKIGMEIGDTSELFFDTVRVPGDNLLGGTEGQGFVQLMQQLPQERLLIGIECVALMERALNETIAYVKERKAFGKSLLEFQNTQFKLAEAKTKATVAKVFVDHCIGLLLEGKLDAVTASMAKLSTSETAQEVIDECLQLHGGYGYMNEYPIAQLYKDIRVKRIFGGTSEIMKLLIARSL
ncbi:acyl-CoA dehydrogenase family protein [Novosphingobium sp. B 225]|uniref:acyl-CoA dehydrogenase family protein n=1 Tax=Novosphingobium sp. B 225 TaxID=1961849 RepID=UPI000B4B6C22|nr:acyl-CoA dehydrogenase family protein [Novosphingobium sp. B 225]